VDREGKEFEKKFGNIVAIIRVVGTPQMVFINPILTTFINMIADQPSMSSIAIGGYKSTDAGNLGGGYREPFGVTVGILIT